MEALLNRLWRLVSCLRDEAPCAGKPSAPPAPDASLGVLFVHGMGTHAPGATLRDFGDPLAELLSRPEIGVEKLTLTDTVLATRGAPAHTRFELSVDGQQRTWLLAESCWSDSFKPAPYAQIAFWLIAAVPWTVGEYVRGAWTREGDAARFRAIRWVRKLLIVLYGAVATLLTGPLVVLLAVLPITRVIPIRAVRDLFDRIPRALAASLGDVYVILTTHLERASIRRQVKYDYDWLDPRCEHRVVVAHSAGAAVTHALIAEEQLTGVKTYVTLDEAIWRMRWMSTLARSGARRVLALAISILGTATLAAVVVLVARESDWWIAALAGTIALHGLSAYVVWNFGITGTRGQVMTELANKVGLWRDYVASSDPIPAGALTEIAHGSTPAGRGRAGDGNYRSVGVHNRRSIFRDHTSYPDNMEEFVAGLAGDLAAADAMEGLFITPSSLAEWKEDRTVRTLSLALLRFCSALAGAVVLLVLLLRPEAGVALGDDTAPGRAARWLVGDAGAAGTVVAIAMLAAAWLVAGAGWRRWNQAARKSFPAFGQARPYIALSFWWATWTTLAAGAALWFGDVEWRSWEAAAVAVAVGAGLVTQMAVVTVAEVRDELYRPG